MLARRDIGRADPAKDRFRSFLLAAHRLRARYRARLRARVAETVATPDEVDDEIRFLLAALG